MFRTVLVAVGISFSATVVAAQVPEKVPQETNQPCAASSEYTLKQFLPCPAPVVTDPGAVDATQRPAVQREVLIDNSRPYRQQPSQPGPGRD